MRLIVTLHVHCLSCCIHLKQWCSSLFKEISVNRNWSWGYLHVMIPCGWCSPFNVYVCCVITECFVVGLVMFCISAVHGLDKLWLNLAVCVKEIYDFCLELECIYCLTQLSSGQIYIYIYIIYYIGNNHMFRHFSLAIFRLIYEKLSKQLYLTCVYSIQWGGKRWSGYEIWHVLCRMGGVGTWVLVFLLF